MELEQLIVTQNASTAYRTVAVVDMVGYSTLARVLEENTGAAAVAELNRQIQLLVQGALKKLQSPQPYSTLAETGDGVILLFEAAQDAHHFATHLHLCAEMHNRSRTEASATRWFRIGIASGEITRTSLYGEESGWAGITIANAVRFEGSANPGEIVMDLATFEALPETLRTLYGRESMVRGKRAEVFQVRKYVAVAASGLGREAAPEEARARWSRRNVLALGAGMAGAAVAGLWLDRAGIDRMLDPLPIRRFVALHAWPKSGEDVAAILNRIVASIDDRLARAEPRDKQFMVMYPGDPLVIASGIALPGDGPTEIATALGANLVLAATSRRVRDRLLLNLRLLDPVSGRVLRRRDLSTKMAEVSGFSKIAADAAARLLDLPAADPALADEEETSEMSTGAFQLLADGKRLMEEPNFAGVDAAVEKLQQLVNEYPRFALGYAELANAYLREFQMRHDPGMIELARQNTQRALQLNPNSARGILAQAKVDVFTGQTDAALQQIGKALKLDPRSWEVLLYKALIFRNLGRLPEEEGVYRQILASRPNNWIAYNELGGVLERQGKYPAATQAFTLAAQIAPKASLPLMNLGGVYLNTGENAKAKDAFERSIALHPDAIAYIGLGNLAFESADYKGAIASYLRARELSPRDYSILQDLGDCYGMLRQNEKVKDYYGQAAELLSKRLQINPKVGSDWMTLSFFHAKIGDFQGAEKDMAAADARGARDLNSQFVKAQTLAVMGRKEEALALLMKCLDGGLPTAAVDLAVDLKELRSDPRYRARIETDARKTDAPRTM